MDELVSLITCTGGRPDAFALCRQFVAFQTYQGPIDWVIIDDGTPPTAKLTASNSNITIRQFAAKRKWEPGLNTHRFNMEEALTKVKGSYCFIIEDDDYYHPAYIQTYVDLLKHVSTVGIANARYYHVNIPGYKTMQNMSHASLSQTAFRTGTGLPLLKKAINSGELYFDIVFWKEVAKAQVSRILLADTNLSIGIKGMPGRPGISPGHREKRDYLYDVNQVKLKEWIGKEADLYVNYKGKIT